LNLLMFLSIGGSETIFFATNFYSIVYIKFPSCKA